MLPEMEKRGQILQGLPPQKNRTLQPAGAEDQKEEKKEKEKNG